MDGATGTVLAAGLTMFGSVLLAVFGILTKPKTPAAAADGEPELSRLRDDNRRLRSELEETVARCRRDRDDLRDEIDETRRERDEARRERDSAVRDATEARAKEQAALDAAAQAHALRGRIEVSARRIEREFEEVTGRPMSRRLTDDIEDVI